MGQSPITNECSAAWSGLLRDPRGRPGLRPGWDPGHDGGQQPPRARSLLEIRRGEALPPTAVVSPIARRVVDRLGGRAPRDRPLPSERPPRVALRRRAAPPLEGLRDGLA